MEFHNDREKDRKELSEDAFNAKYSNKKFYAVTRKSEQFVNEWFAQNCPGKVALDYCCGLGQVSLRLAKAGAEVYGIDISDESVSTSEQRLKDAGFAEKSHFQVMDAENMLFADNMFDVIVCSGVLHHLDLQYAYPELSRVLKPGGKIICMEALGYNPVINLYRRRTPALRTEWEVDHILTLKQVNQAKAFFGNADVNFFHLCSIAAVPFRRSTLFKPVLSLLEFFDRLILKIPFVQLLAWQMIFILSKPKQTS